MNRIISTNMIQVMSETTYTNYSSFSREQRLNTTPPLIIFLEFYYESKQTYICVRFSFGDIKLLFFCLFAAAVSSF